MEVNIARKCRPIDASLKVGDVVVSPHTASEYVVVALQDAAKRIVVRGVASKAYSIKRLGAIRQKPLVVIDNTPIYSGDTLYVTEDEANYAGVVRGEPFKVDSLSSTPGYLTGQCGLKTWCIPTDNLTCVKPKVKKTAWMNIYHNGRAVHLTKAGADHHAASARIKCVEISWEE